MDGEEVVGTVYLAGGMPFKAEARVAVAHAAAVVYDLYQRTPGILDYKVNLRGTGIHGVLK
jgi:hypothetical protein